jgi:hypothetical protein
MVAPDLVGEEDIAKLIIPDDLPDEQPTFKAYIEAKVYDEEGRLIQYHRQPMRSLTQYFLALVAIPLIGTYQGPSSNQAIGILTNVLGLPSQVQSSISNNLGSANILWDWSLQLGSGTRAFSPTLTGLAAPIANGSGAGQLVYGTESISYTRSSIYISLQVTNTNSSAVTVTEIGIQGTIYLQYHTSSDSYAYSSYNFLLSYDTFSTAITVPAYGMAVFQITLSFTG